MGNTRLVARPASPLTDPTLGTIAIAPLAALAGALVLAAVVLLAGGDGNAPMQIVLPTPDEALGQAGSAGGPPTHSPKVEAELKVDIRGAVRNPGIYPLHPGATGEAEKEALHLSRRVLEVTGSEGEEGTAWEISSAVFCRVSFSPRVLYNGACFRSMRVTGLGFCRCRTNL